MLISLGGRTWANDTHVSSEQTGESSPLKQISINFLEQSHRTNDAPRFNINKLNSKCNAAFESNLLYTFI